MIFCHTSKFVTPALKHVLTQLHVILHGRTDSRTAFNTKDYFDCIQNVLDKENDRRLPSLLISYCSLRACSLFISSILPFLIPSYTLSSLLLPSSLLPFWHENRQQGLVKCDLYERFTRLYRDSLRSPLQPLMEVRLHTFILISK